MFQYLAGVAPPFGIRDITDGTSHTIAFGEWKTGDGNSALVTPATDLVWLGSGPPNTARNTNGTYTMPNAVLVANFPTWLNSCAAGLLADRTNQTGDLGRDWAFGINNYTLGNTLQAPNPKFPNCMVVPVSSNALGNCGIWGMASFHPGGANTLMCDGSVKFLKDTTSLPTVWALGSRAQGEIIDATAY